MKTIGSHLATLLAGETKLRRQLGPFVKYVVLLVAVVLLVLVGPWTLMVFFVGPTELARTLRDGLRPKGGAGQSQERSATVLRRTEGLTFATGFVVALLAMHAGGKPGERMGARPAP